MLGEGLAGGGEVVGGDEGRVVDRWVGGREKRGEGHTRARMESKSSERDLFCDGINGLRLEGGGEVEEGGWLTMTHWPLRSFSVLEGGAAMLSSFENRF